ncbi:MAG: chemotaxis response regulator protein-glutamate methylesterase [Peptococcaceae bacterium]|jgi:two-component system chemotaxis response regulator CheB|nr:chemotaxis response regulator protein-glutamate methylesterase [Peptococcaceae bacterium]
MRALSKQSPVTVLIVDDSSFMRMTIQRILGQDPLIKVIDSARDGLEGIEKLKALNPQVVVMDVEMPRMNGLRALEEIMRWQPTPVVILSASAAEEGQLTLQALELGAIDAVVNPTLGRSSELTESARDLIEKVKGAALVDLKRMKARMGREGLALTGRGKQPEKKGRKSSLPEFPVELVAIGTSTGGPPALQAVLSKLPADFPVPVIVAQHMPAGFTAPLAQRLDRLCPLNVQEAAQGDVLRPGSVYIAPAGLQMQVQRKQNQLTLMIGKETPVTTIYKPSVDVMFLSAAREIGAGSCCVIMTGMGNDGLQGTREVKAQKGFVIAEAEESCVVYGMPKAVIEAGLADRIAPLPEIAKTMIECIMRR